MVPERPAPTLPPPEALAVHLSGSRRRILQVLRDCGPRTDEGIAACWISVDGDGDRWGGRLPGLVARLTWKLEYLGWIERGEDGWVLSAVGAQALDAAS